MHVVIHLSDGSTLEWADLPTWDLAELQGSLLGGESVPVFVQMTMDETTVIIATEHIVRVDIEGL